MLQRNRIRPASRRARALLVAGGLALASGAVSASGSPEEPDALGPDLRIEWDGPAPDRAEPAPLRGAPGERLAVYLRTSNLGAEPAFALIVEAHTAIGRHGRPQRIQPGPGAGGVLAHRLDLTLARGMRELCVTARLQRAEAGDPEDGNLENNRVCRSIEVEPSPPPAEATDAETTEAEAPEEEHR